MLPRMVLLGILMSGPKHGYQVSLYVRELMSRLAKMTPGSIYYNLKRMDREGLLKRRTSRQGNRPERQVYTITDKGVREFKRLLTASLFTKERPVWPFNLAVFFLRHADPEEARRAIKERLKRLKREREEVEVMEKVAEDMKLAFHLSSLIQHGLLHLKAEISWTKGLLKGLEEKRPLVGADYEDFLKRFRGKLGKTF